MKIQFSEKQTNMPRKNTEFERGKELSVPRVCYLAEKFPDSKKHGRE